MYPYRMTQWIPTPGTVQPRSTNSIRPCSLRFHVVCLLKSNRSPMRLRRFNFFISSSISGTTLKRPPTRGSTATWKIRASSSLLIATMTAYTLDSPVIFHFS